MSRASGSSGPPEKRLRQVLLQFKPSESDNLVLNNGQNSVDLIQDASGSGVPVSDETSPSPSSNINVHSESVSFASPKTKFQPILPANQPTDTDAYGDKYLLIIGGKRRSFQAGRPIFLATWLV
jgi:hypothetical protein